MIFHQNQQKFTTQCGSLCPQCNATHTHGITIHLAVINIPQCLSLGTFCWGLVTINSKSTCKHPPPNPPPPPPPHTHTHTHTHTHHSRFFAGTCTWESYLVANTNGAGLWVYTYHGNHSYLVRIIGLMKKQILVGLLHGMECTLHTTL